MAIYGIGAYYNEDVSSQFISRNIVGVDWDSIEAPDLHQFLSSLKVGDIVYIKAFPPGGDLIIKSIGVIIDNLILGPSDTNNLVSCGRNVRWIFTEQFNLSITAHKNNVRSNTLYEEFHPDVQREIINRVLGLITE